MSCTKSIKEANASIQATYSCPCDSFVFPSPLLIGAGLDKLPRQTGTFPEFRRAMLQELRRVRVEVIDSTNTLAGVLPLADWRAREKDDYGIMLLEMWACVCDCLSFYDEQLANEFYLGTCGLKPNLRRLVALLGYLPRPAVGSVVDLAAIADGRQLVRLPAGTAFRSGAFDGNPPQVFELDQDTFIHPFTNRSGIVPPHKGVLQEDNPDSLLVNLNGEVREDDLLLLVNREEPEDNGCLQVKKLDKYIGNDKVQYNRMTFGTPVNLTAGTPLANLRLLKPVNSTGLWTKGDAEASVSGDKITLNTLNQQVKPGDFIILVCNLETQWFRVEGVNETTRPLNGSGTVSVNSNVFTIDGFGTSVTELTLHQNVFFNDLDPGKITVYYGMQSVATITDEPNAALSPDDDLLFDSPLEAPVESYCPSSFLLQDKNTLGTRIGGRIRFEQQALEVNEKDKWKKLLRFPVDVYGNVIKVSRGETVENEKMGSGDASLASQSFRLKKKPLAYHLCPTANNDQGVKSSLTVYVDGIQWTEAKSFYGKSAYDQVYIVRQNDQGESVVTFGDGVRGQRLPSGIDNVIGNYRFGAEAACPPPGSVNQISKPVKGLRSVNNILSAYGGADPQSAESIRTHAPKSALILGRIVSISDIEAVAASYSGVRAVQAEWRWDGLKQRATAHLYYIGSDSLKASLSSHIRNLSDPSTPITIDTADPVPFPVTLSVVINPSFLEQEVVGELFKVLLDPVSGLFAPENIGIGKPLFRSKIFEAVLSVRGVDAVQKIVANEKEFDSIALKPDAGSFFDVEQGGLVINGQQNG